MLYKYMRLFTLQNTALFALLRCALQIRDILLRRAAGYASVGELPLHGSRAELIIRHGDAGAAGEADDDIVIL